MATYEPVGQLKFKELGHRAGMFLAQRFVDVDAQTGAASDGQIDQNDVLTAIPVKKGEIVLSAWVEVMTACTGGASADIGVGELVDYWANGVALDSAIVEGSSTAGTGGPHKFSAADTVDLQVLEAAVTAGIFRVCALIIRGVN
jgi:hypothetical protein